MSEPSETKDNNNFDAERVYCTNALIKKVGGAVAVSLSDATLPGNANNKHMTILYRRGQRWTENEIELISKETDNWIKQKYDSNQAPVTFTINKWGKKSVKIQGDLESLCLYLRQKFGHFSNDKQRIPHCELFVNGRHNDNNKTCHICGESGHYKRFCPQKQDKKYRKKGGRRHSNNDLEDEKCYICGQQGHFKRDCPQKKARKNGKNDFEEETCYICGQQGHFKRDCPQKKGRKNGKKCGNYNSEKVRERLERMISKMQELKQKKQREILLLNEQEKQLQELLNNADNLDDKTLKDQIKNIAKSFKNQRKQFKNGNNNKHYKKYEKKYEKKQFKQQRKEFNKKRKEQRKLEKEERKRLKKEKVEILSIARLESLPLNKNEIGNSTLYIYVDGYNIIGCDSLCRKNMRGRGGGMKKSRSRLAKLLQENFLDKFGELKLDYNVVMDLWFDGNGRNEKCGDIQVTFSTKKQIVDDKLVEKFSKNNKEQNSNILVVTTDKELTLRLYNIGCKVIKSSTFYKKYLKEKKGAISASNPNDDNDNDDEKKEEFEQDTNDDEFVKIIANKMKNDGEDSPDGDYGDYDEGDYTPDEVEGGNDNLHQYRTPNNDDYEDYEFTSIFGEEMDIIDFD